MLFEIIFSINIILIYWMIPKKQRYENFLILAVTYDYMVITCWLPIVAAV